MHIGVIPFLNRHSGGAYQYSQTMLSVLSRLKRDGGKDEFMAFAYEPEHAEMKALAAEGWSVSSVAPPKPRIFDRLFGRGQWLSRIYWWYQDAFKKIPSPDSVRYRPEFAAWFRSFGVELMLYPFPTALSFESRIPYIMAVHDLQHRLQPEFPEVSADGEWGRREYLFRNGCRYATLLLVDSEVGKEDVLKFYGPYGIDADRIKVLPYLPAQHLPLHVSEKQRAQVRNRYQLPERYLFYPAQFWPHKNHLRIIEALGLLEGEYRLKIPVVFCGSDVGPVRQRTLEEVRSLSRRFGLEDRIFLFEYVPDEDMAGLYAEAVALVMPTFFGPTNIPVLEAWSFGCPVLTSDIRGIREQAGDAAVLVDPRSTEAIAEGIRRLWTDEALRRTLALRGRERLSAYSPGDYQKRLVEILEEAKARVHSQNTGGNYRGDRTRGGSDTRSDASSAIRNER